MMQWRVRLLIALGALALAAPAFARPEGTSGKQPTWSAPAATVDDESESRPIEGDGGDPPPELEDKEIVDNGHFGW